MKDWTVIEPYCREHGPDLTRIDKDRPFVTLANDGTEILYLDWNVVECVPTPIEKDQSRDRRACRGWWRLDIRNYKRGTVENL